MAAAVGAVSSGAGATSSAGGIASLDRAGQMGNQVMMAGLQQMIGRNNSNQSWDRQKYAIKHAVRWRVKDLRAAGINPILAGGFQGSGASPATAITPDFSAAAARGLDSDSRKQDALSKRQQANIGRDLATGQIGLLNEQVNSQREQQDLFRAQAEAQRANARNADSNTDLNSLAVPKAKVEADMYDTLGLAIPFGEAVSSALRMTPMGRLRGLSRFLLKKGGKTPPSPFKGSDRPYKSSNVKTAISPKWETNNVITPKRNRPPRSYFRDYND